jgi:hypothetical protein
MEATKLISLDLSLLSEEVIDILLMDNTAEPTLLDEIAQKNTHRPEILRHLLNHPNTPDNTRQLIARILQVPLPTIKPREAEIETPEEETKRERRTQTLLQRIQKLKVGERIQLALKGGKEIRPILLRDSNREVMLTVLENPKITENEIELIAKQRTTSDEVIRTIAKKREWMKNYSIVHALVTNPKTPVAIALKYVPKLKIRDLQLVEKNKNISSAVRAAAKKIVAARRPS